MRKSVRHWPRRKKTARSTPTLATLGYETFEVSLHEISHRSVRSSVRYKQVREKSLFKLVLLQGYVQYSTSRILLTCMQKVFRSKLLYSPIFFAVAFFLQIWLSLRTPVFHVARSVTWSRACLSPSSMRSADLEDFAGRLTWRDLACRGNPHAKSHSRTKWLSYKILWSARITDNVLFSRIRICLFAMCPKCDMNNWSVG